MQTKVLGKTEASIADRKIGRQEERIKQELINTMSYSTATKATGMDSATIHASMPQLNSSLNPLLLFVPIV